MEFLRSVLKSRKIVSSCLTTAVVFTTFVVAVLQIVQSNSISIACGGGWSSGNFNMNARLGGFDNTLGVVAVFITIVMSIASYKFYFGRNEKKYLALYVLLCPALLAIALVEMVALMYTMGEYSGMLKASRYITSKTCWEKGSGTLDAILVFLCLEIACVMATGFYSYAFVATLEGPSLMEFSSQWCRRVANALQQGSVGFLSLPTKFLGPSIVKVRPYSQELYTEVELEEKTMICLRNSISKKFNVPMSAIRQIIKDRDTIVENDGDVKRLDYDSRLDVVLDPAEANSSNGASDNNEGVEMVVVSLLDEGHSHSFVNPSD